MMLHIITSAGVQSVIISFECYLSVFILETLDVSSHRILKVIKAVLENDDLKVKKHSNAHGPVHQTLALNSSWLPQCTPQATPLTLYLHLEK